MTADELRTEVLRHRDDPQLRHGAIRRALDAPDAAVRRAGVDEILREARERGLFGNDGFSLVADAAERTTDDPDEVRAAVWHAARAIDFAFADPAPDHGRFVAAVRRALADRSSAVRELVARLVPLFELPVGDLVPELADVMLELPVGDHDRFLLTNSMERGALLGEWTRAFCARYPHPDQISLDHESVLELADLICAWRYAQRGDTTFQPYVEHLLWAPEAEKLPPLLVEAIVEDAYPRGSPPPARVAERVIELGRRRPELRRMRDDWLAFHAELPDRQDLRDVLAAARAAEE